MTNAVGEAGPTIGAQRWPHQGRQVVYSKHGMVACSVPKASLVGIEILKQGGTAVDAAIAAGAYLGSVEPLMSGIGGDLLAIVWNESNPQYAKGLHGLNASSRSPYALTIDAVKNRYPDAK